MKILYADESPLLLDIIRDIISLLGHEATVLSDPTEVLGEIIRNDYDIVLIDSKLDNNNGFEVAKRSIKNIRNLNAKVILFSPFASEELKRKCLKEGLAGAIRQPLGIEDFRDIITNPRNFPVFPIRERGELHWVA